MGLINRLKFFVARVVVQTIQHQITEIQRRLRSEERRLAYEISDAASVPVEKVNVRLSTFPGGFIFPYIEVKCGLSCQQLARVQDVLDTVNPIRQNVRSPAPMLN